MSGRRRRSESLWDRKEEETVPETEISEKIPRQGKELHYSSLHGDTSPKQSNSEANDVLMSDDFSGQPSREPMQGNENMPTDDVNSRMKTDPAFDEWENQYSSRPSDDSYGLPYRADDRGDMSRDRDRSRSPHESRGRTRDRGVARSRSRSRGRDRDRGRARSPLSGGNRLDNDLTEKRTIRPDYSGGPRYTDDRDSADRSRNRGSDGYRKDTGRNEASREISKDYQRGNKNTYDDQDQRRQSNRSNKVPCKFFSMGKCNRNNCKFSHDAPESGRSHDNIQGHNSGDNNMPWNNVESASLDENIQGHTLDDSYFQQHQRQGDGNVAMMIDNSDAHKINQQIQFPSYGEDFIQTTVHNLASTLNGTQQSSHMPSQFNGSGQDMFFNLDLQNTTGIQNKQSGKPLETLKNDLSQVTSLPVSLPEKLNLANALELLYTLPISTSSGAPVDSMVGQQNLDTKSKEQSLSNSLQQENQMPVEQFSSISTRNPNGIPDAQEPVGKLEGNENKTAENPRNEQEKTNIGKSEAQGKVEEGNISNDEKAMRQFKIALVEFVKEILKPTWKEGKMSREVYKTIVKKVVDKVTSSIQGIQIPRTQEKIDQYLAFSKSKITKLVEAYVGRFLKA